MGAFSPEPLSQETPALELGSLGTAGERARHVAHGVNRASCFQLALSAAHHLQVPQTRPGLRGPAKGWGPWEPDVKHNASNL